MKTELIYIGQNGSTLDLVQSDFFYLSHADGITAATASLSSSTNPIMDGDTINNIQTQARGIVLDLSIKQSADVEEAKRYILRAIKPKQRGTLRLTQGDRVTEIVGIVESVDMPRFGQGVTMQISLYCSEPYWRDVESVAVEISRVIDLFHFPVAFPAAGIPFGVYDTAMTRSITNDGDAECGMVITIIALAETVNPTLYKADGSYIGVTDTLEAGDEVIINTNRGEKAITKNGASIFSKIKSGSTFLQLDTGVNALTIDSDGGTEGNMYFNVAFKRRFV